MHTMDESDITDWPSCKLGKKFSNLERNFRCLICRDMYENPQMLNCGHSYCSLCIRQHLDHALNSNNSNRCPDCKEKSEVCHLKPNLNLASAILAYKELRADVLNELTSNGDSTSARGSSSTSRRTKKERESRDAPVPVSRKMPHMSFHGKSKKYVKDAIDKICSNSKVRPSLEGDQSQLEGFYRQLVHLNNAQIGSLEPLSFDAVVKESVKKYESIRKEARSYGASKGCAENMKNGVISDSANSGFRLLIQQANAAKQKLAESSLLSQSGEAKATKAGEELELEPGEYTDGDWRVIMSDKLARPFFFNTKTGLGSFAVPPEIAERTDDVEVVATNDSLEDVCIPLCDSVNSGKRKRSSSVDILAQESSSSSPLTDTAKGSSSDESCENVNAIKVSGSGTAAAVRNLVFVTEGETPAVTNSTDHSNHIVCETKRVQSTPTIEILDDDDEDEVEKDTDRLHAPDFIEKDEESAMNIRNQDKGGVMESVYQSTDGTQLDTNPSMGKNSNGSSSSSRVSISSLVESNLSSWSCSQCTFENKASVFTCCMCDMPSGRHRRSQRDSQNTIMQGFALTHSQQFNISADGGPSSSSRQSGNPSQNLSSSSSSLANNEEIVTPAAMKQSSRRK